MKINSIKSLKPLKSLKALKQGSDTHLPRRIWHMTTGVIGLLYYLLAEKTPVEMSNLLLTLGAVVFIIETLRLKSSRFNSLVLNVMGPLMREKERNQYSGYRFWKLWSYRPYG